MAIVAPILILFFMATLEMGLMVKDTLVVNAACREGARVAGLGWTTTQITSQISAAATTLNASTITTTLQYRTCTSGVWGSWSTLGNSGSNNNAPSGSQVQVKLTYPHHLVTGGLFASVANGGSNTVRISGQLLTLRE
jgi:Flp pilus assembly protein TadG